MNGIELPQLSPSHPPTVFVDLTKYSFAMNQNQMGKLTTNVDSFESKEDGN